MSASQVLDCKEKSFHNVQKLKRSEKLQCDDSWGWIWSIVWRWETFIVVVVLAAPHSIQSDIAKSDSVRFSDDFVRHPSRLHCINHEGLEIGVPTLYLGRIRHDFDRYVHIKMDVMTVLICFRHWLCLRVLPSWIKYGVHEQITKRHTHPF